MGLVVSTTPVSSSLARGSRGTPSTSGPLLEMARGGLEETLLPLVESWWVIDEWKVGKTSDWRVKSESWVIDRKWKTSNWWVESWWVIDVSSSWKKSTKHFLYSFSLISVKPLLFSSSFQASNMLSPRGVAVDWVNNMVYVGCKDAIHAVAMDGSANVIVMKDPDLEVVDIVVHPQTGTMFWTSNVQRQGLQVAFMDGRKRRSLLPPSPRTLPSGLAIDYPARRLYWTDARSHAIFTSKLDGSDRRMVNFLPFFSSITQKVHLDLFEDHLYVSRGDGIFKLHKHGIGQPRNISHLKSIHALAIVQEHKFDTSITKRCVEKSCPEGLVCLLSGRDQVSCVCPIGSMHLDCIDKDRCRNGCGAGTCEVRDGDYKCICPPGYSGNSCEIIDCPHFCDHGICNMVDGKITCQCDGGWGGDRCNISTCGDDCINNTVNASQCQLKCQSGICVIASGSGRVFCKCDSGYHGHLCQYSRCNSPITGSYCNGKGVCSLNEVGSPQCRCEPGYSGPQCQKSLCDGFCVHGSCRLEGRVPICTCLLGYEGERCAHPMSQGCHNLQCYNGGTCYPDIGPRGECECPPSWGGLNCLETRDASIDLCKGVECKHAGFCNRDTGKCRCPKGWAGSDCSHAKSCRSYCFNGGTCEVNPDPSLSLVCNCAPGFYGTRCEQSLETLIFVEEGSDNSAAVIASTVITLLVLAAVVVLGAWWKCVHRRGRIEHVRLEDNVNAGTVELTNPIFMHHSEANDEPVFTLKDSVSRR